MSMIPTIIPTNTLNNKKKIKVNKEKLPSAVELNGLISKLSLNVRSWIYQSEPKPEFGFTNHICFIKLQNACKVVKQKAGLN